MTMEWMFESEEYVPDYSAHVRAAYATRHDEHVRALRDKQTDDYLASIGARRVWPRLVKADAISVQPMTGPIPLSLTMPMRL